MKKTYYAVFQTHAGWMGVAGSARGICCTTLPRASREEALSELGEDVLNSNCDPDFFQELIARFQAYFAGTKTDFCEKLDLSEGTPFQREVWETARLIGYGETRSYGWIAKNIKKPGASRAVGRALGKNPVPLLVPCHRVVAADGGLCGFAGGLETKKTLLRLEVSSWLLKTPG